MPTSGLQISVILESVSNSFGRMLVWHSVGPELHPQKSIKSGVVIYASDHTTQGDKKSKAILDYRTV